MIIRPAGTEDLAALAAFARRTYADAFGHSFSPEDLAAHLRDNLADGYFHQALAEDVFLLAESEGRLIASCSSVRYGSRPPRRDRRIGSCAGSMSSPNSRTRGPAAG
jgi:hypothetical protein